MRFVLWRIKENLLDGLCWIKDIMIEVIIGDLFFIIETSFYTVRYLLYKLLSGLLGITNLGFIVGMGMAFYNVYELFNRKVNFSETKFFELMLWMCGVHIILFYICKIVRPKNID